VNPQGLVQEALFLQSEVSTVLASALLRILVGFDSLVNTSPCDAWHYDQSASIELELTLEETRLAEECGLLLLRRALSTLLFFLFMLLRELILKVLRQSAEGLSILLVDKSDEASAFMIRLLCFTTIDRRDQITTRLAQHGIPDLTELLHVFTEHSLICVPTDVPHKQRGIGVFLGVLALAFGLFGPFFAGFDLGLLLSLFCLTRA